MKFYIMYAETCIEEYVRPGDELDALKKGCYKSELQFLDRAPIEAGLSSDGGTVFPDFLMHAGCVPLISEKFRQVMDRHGIDNLFYKPVILTDKTLGLRERYWLALPPRIRCLNLSKSEFEIEDNEYVDDEDKFREVSKIVISPRATGNYKIFKLPMEYENQEIIVREDLRSAIGVQSLSNVYFTEL